MNRQWTFKRNVHVFEIQDQFMHENFQRQLIHYESLFFNGFELQVIGNIFQLFYE